MIHMVPTFGQVPIFGDKASECWLWNLDSSLGYIGLGIITGPAVAFGMIVGARLRLGGIVVAVQNKRLGTRSYQGLGDRCSGLDSLAEPSSAACRLLDQLLLEDSTIVERHSAAGCE
jgi:hypothetical protein